MSRAEPPATSTAPGTSIRAEAGFEAAAAPVDAESADPAACPEGRNSADPSTADTPIGTLIQKIQCQLSPWVTAPPTSGPPATARPLIPPKIPTTAPRRAAGNAAARSVRASGVTAAAPRPWTARATMSRPAFGATPHAAEARVNTARPAM